jgi:hypothetical protein
MEEDSAFVVIIVVEEETLGLFGDRLATTYTKHFEAHDGKEKRKRRTHFTTELSELLPEEINVDD